MIYKEKSRGFVKQVAGKEKEIGNQYLRQIRESIISHDRRMKSIANDNISGEIPISPNFLHGENHDKPQQQQQQVLQHEILGKEHSKPRQGKLEALPPLPIDKLAKSAIYLSNSQILLSDSRMLVEKKVLRPKNYMSEIRNRFNLDNRKEVWEKITEGAASSARFSPFKQQKILEHASAKFDEDIKRKVQLLKFNKTDDLSIKEVQHRHELDEAYFKSIKAKIAMMSIQLNETEEEQRAPTPQQPPIQQLSQPQQQLKQKLPQTEQQQKIQLSQQEPQQPQLPQQQPPQPSHRQSITEQREEYKDRMSNPNTNTITAK